MKKISKIQIARYITQIAFLVLIPGLFTLAFGELKEIHTMLLNGNFNFISTLPKLAEITALIVLTAIVGRFFCGWMCAFGTINDILYKISGKFVKANFKISKKADSVLKYLKYVILAFIVIVIWTFGTNIFSTFDPWGAFAQIPDIKEAINSYMVGLILLALIAFGAMFIERFFCRYLCPLGAVFAIASKIRIFSINKPKSTCGNCRICTHKCVMGISLYEDDKVKSGECIGCLKCVDVCPKNNSKAAFAGKSITPAVGSTIGIAACIGILSISKVLTNNVDSSSDIAVAASQNKISATTDNSKIYNDGTYTGIGRGYRPNLEVDVTIKNDKITNIEIGSNNETPRYAQRPFNTIPKEIIASQSTDVDTISGATRTCKGIIMAVEDALIEAKAEASVINNN